MTAVDIDALEARLVAVRRGQSPVHFGPKCNEIYGPSVVIDAMLAGYAALPAILAELRAAREVVAMARQAYKADAIYDWFDAEDDGLKKVLRAYDEVTK